MHETDIFTSLGHWELISHWLKSGGKWKPLSKHSMLFFLWACSWRWSQPEMVPWDVSGCGGSPSPAWQPWLCPAQSIWWIWAFPASRGHSWRTSPCLQPLVLQCPRAWPGGAAPAQPMERLGLTQEQPQDPPGMPGSWPHQEKGKSRANVREGLPSTTPSPYQALPKPHLPPPDLFAVDVFIL